MVLVHDSVSKAKYITGTLDALQSKPGGGAEWLMSLRKLDLREVIDALCTLPGVGTKETACIDLFSFDQHHAFVLILICDSSEVEIFFFWGLSKIVTRYLLPELAGARLTPKLCNRVPEAFVSKDGNNASLAQTVLFIAELPSQKAILPSNFSAIKENKSTKRKEREASSGS